MQAVEKDQEKKVLLLTRHSSERKESKFPAHSMGNHSVLFNPFLVSLSYLMARLVFLECSLNQRGLNHAADKGRARNVTEKRSP